LENGTADEIRSALLGIGLSLEHEGCISPKAAVWLGRALQQIADGMPADKALGLKNKRKYGVYYAKAVELMIDTAEGASRSEAAAIVARCDPATGTLRDDPNDSYIERLKKRRQRQAKK